MSNRQGYCIFCKDPGLTKEHIWANWLEPYLKRTYPRTKHILDWRVRGPNGFTRTVSKGRLDRQGDPRTQKLYIVCKKCNNGWMSALQEAAKPVLVPLIGGNWYALPPQDQTVLSAWATMFTMVYEWADPKTVAATDDERRFLREFNKSPDHWNVWIGRYEGTARIDTKHTGIRFSRKGDDMQSLTCNTQITTFVAGEIVFHLFSSTAEIIREFDLDASYEHELKIRRIWPCQPHAVMPTDKLNAPSVYNVMETLRGLLMESTLA